MQPQYFEPAQFVQELHSSSRYLDIQRDHQARINQHGLLEPTYL
jgi:hypothetical protein